MRRRVARLAMKLAQSMEQSSYLIPAQIDYTSGMTRHDAIARLTPHADALKTRGATSLYLFGSVARDEARAASDLDLFIDYDRDGHFNAFDLVGIKQYLEQMLGVDVDVTTRDSLHPMLRPDIERSAVRVF
jgi:predicted nucleotidyltransferase